MKALTANAQYWDSYTLGPHFPDGDRRQDFDWGWDSALEWFATASIASQTLSAIEIRARSMKSLNTSTIQGIQNIADLAGSTRQELLRLAEDHS